MPLDNLYYVHRITPPADFENRENKNKYLLYLLPTTEQEIVDEVETWPYIFSLPVDSNLSIEEMTVTYFQKLTGIYEGCFVGIKKDGLINANSTKLAKQNILEANKCRNNLKKYIAYSSDDVKGVVSEVCSYHVNVGHGNTSIIAFKNNGMCRLWMIDCAYKEIKTWHSYRDNIDACFEHIKNKYDLQEIKIEKLLITHLHYDHISTVTQLMQEQYFADNFEVWLNNIFACSTKTYLDMVNELGKYAKQPGKECKIIDPVVSSSQRAIKVLYPQTSYTGTRLKTANRAPDGKINNASSVFQINLAGHSMIFPGDIENKGWAEVKNYRYRIAIPDYYCLSHHGSINGHDPTVWCLPKCALFDDIMCCYGMKKAILMGRDKAYSGIFSLEVTNYFKPILNITEEVHSFLELEWENEKINVF